MLKKIMFLSATLFLSACATNPEGVSSEQFASTAKLSKGYNFTEIVGEKIRPINLTEKNGLLVMNVDVTLFLKVGEDQTSRLFLNLQFLENYQRYQFSRVDGDNHKTKQRKETVRQCDDQCSVTQYLVIEIETELLNAARNEGLIFAINKEETSTDFIFKIPANYIEGLFKRFEIENKTEKVTTDEAVIVTEEMNKAVEMSQYWFNKLSSEEQIAFSTWAIKSSKAELPVIEGSKELDRLYYWYQEATMSEQKSFRVWAMQYMK
ncbi:hypothetical protein [Psychromonas sp. psych-6C06]|uniref:hypothetical protein n=1 Tax=Psychromonas sp. psych-6C06 TaxID=2058089 RepID=UPI00129003E8|nr:hypothetical protein [Psychromonas sp. psych-6C06]